ncbi:alpha/beta fold hydrolase [Streptomyces sp. R302]|uniref:alpha/beta fold hydrolase n=1 Tax=unclassified Streptomyces TaxID=2593676 RepID=UPI00145D5A27|nr:MULTISPECIES: alpha/beta fold hydrolase [unclassified Streptomyces]NML49464.1 alpha/beta fold hydrolase [Streptomyces sp. R301]NML77791.1 alpha/beta fold hydrolase [Streptomyces sp. R302]
MSFVRLGGLAHHVAVDGEGPVCVLSAGLGLGWFDWDPVVPLLAPHRTVVRFDRPGHGLTQEGTAPPTLAGEADRIAALLDALALPGRATVVGHSIAGLHAEGFARLHPGRTAALVLVDSSVEDDPRPGGPVLAAATEAAGTALTALGLPAALGPALRRLAVRPDPAPPAEVRRVYRASRVWRGALRENASYGSVAAELLALRRVRPLPPGAPVTVLAAPDGSARWEHRQRTLARRLGARYEAAEPSGHLVMRDAPGTLARVVLQALQEAA